MIKKIILTPKKDTSIVFSIRIDKNLVVKFDNLSQMSGHSRNELIRLAMENYIENVQYVAEEDQKYE